MPKTYKKKPKKRKMVRYRKQPSLNYMRFRMRLNAEVATDENGLVFFKVAIYNPQNHLIPASGVVGVPLLEESAIMNLFDQYRPESTSVTFTPFYNQYFLILNDADQTPLTTIPYIYSVYDLDNSGEATVNSIITRPFVKTRLLNRKWTIKQKMTRKNRIYQGTGSTFSPDGWLNAQNAPNHNFGSLWFVSDKALTDNSGTVIANQPIGRVLVQTIYELRSRT